MSARHARTDDDAVTTVAAPLRLVDPDPFEPETIEAEFSPEVRAVLDAVAMLHSAVISWAAATTGSDHARHDATSAGGRHRR